MNPVKRTALKDRLKNDVNALKAKPIGYIHYGLEIKRCDECDQRKHGHWMNQHLNKYGHPCHHCSECGFLASQKDRNYCPNCGAKMDAKEDAYA